MATKRGGICPLIKILFKQRSLTMIIVKLDGLRKCKICGSSNIVLRRDASKAFQVYCEKCGNRTKWQKKTEAVIEWFNQ